MRKILLFSIFVAFAVTTVSAQMYVSPSSYVYVNDQFVYVTQDVELDNTSNFYLRNQSQLLQGSTGAGANSGTGDLSVYQEGTTNNFQYNYWCSPVGVPSGGAGNTNFGITRLYRPSVADKITSAPATIITGLDGVATNSSLSISNRWIWKYIARSVYAPGGGGWEYVGSGSTVNPGLGFTMKGTSGTDNLVSDSNDAVQNNLGSAQRYDFRGRPNNGDMTAPVSNNDGVNFINLTLVGNPYPSAINLNHYLLENSGYTVDASGNVSGTGAGAQINNTAYFWEHSKSNNTHLVSGYVGGYGTYVPNMTNIANQGTYTAAPMSTYSADGESTTGGFGSNIGGGALNTIGRMFTPIGQGFMVHGVVNPGVVTMKNKYRVFRKEDPTTSQFEKSANSVDNEYWEEIPNIAGIDYTQHKKNAYDPKFRIQTIINNEVAYENALVFGNIASENYDYFDGICAHANNSKVSYLLTQDGLEKLVISSQPFDINSRFPITFVTDELASFEVKVSDYSQFDDLADNIYLHDKQNGIYYDIKNGSYNANLPAGEYANRFEITFKNAASDLVNDNALVADSFQVYQNNDAGMLTVFNSMNKDVIELSLYDVTGKLVISKENLGKGDRIEVSTSGLSDGVYIVKLNTKDNFAVDKKVSIFR